MSGFVWKVGERLLKRGDHAMLMGILNVTPDSFSDGGQHDTVEKAVSHGMQLAADGADIIDIGGESTRPGAEPVSAADEISRTVPVIEKLAPHLDVPISIDTTKADVARQAINVGASIINDISGMTFDPEMLHVAKDTDASVCLMHIKGTPQTMQREPTYEDVASEVSEFLESQMQSCLEAGIRADRICLDPGIGFGKTAEHNLTLMKAVPHLKERLKRPLLIGHSRKRFLSKILGRDVEERLAGTVGVSVALNQLGVDILRIHDVRATRDALLAAETVLKGKLT